MPAAFVVFNFLIEFPDSIQCGHIKHGTYFGAYTVQKLRKLHFLSFLSSSVGVQSRKYDSEKQNKLVYFGNAMKY